jgi:hypothetical protein
VTNGTVSAANFSVGGIGGGEGGEGAGAGTCVAVAGGGGAGDARSGLDGAGVAGVEAVTLAVSGFSTLLKYKNPPTPIAAIHTRVTATGHIQFGIAAAAAGFFLTCGVV